jgi:hypothetical protein
MEIPSAMHHLFHMHRQKDEILLTYCGAVDNHTITPRVPLNIFYSNVYILFQNEWKTKSRRGDNFT